MPDSFEHFLAERLQAEAILESLAEGVVAVDAAGDFVAINPAARALLGVGQQPLVGANLFETLRQRDLHDLVREVMGTGRLTLRDFPLFAPRERILRAQGVPCLAPGPGGARVVLLLQDVTELHRYDQLRREFVANVSHELKSPLTSIRSLTETLLDGGLEDPGCNRRFMALIEEDSTRLARLIDDLLILSQVESRAIPLRLSAVELDQVVTQVLAPREVLVAEKQVRILRRLDPELLVRADPDRLRQVLDNLLDNAIKYSPRGGRVEILAYPVEQHRVQVRVHDQGPGIPPEARGRVFERFYRVDKNRSRELGGTGLGLSIVKHIVESHGGRCWVEGALGEGSQFCFTLPLAAHHQDEVVPPAADSVESLELPRPVEDELSHLQERLLVMAGLVEEAVGRSVQALVLRDGKLARQVLERDRVIDQSELVIDEICLRLLAERHASGGDLRLIAMAFKINADLERIGDLAVNIAERTLDLLRQPLLLPLVDIQTMAEQVQTMVKASLDALVQRDVEAALEVCRRDIVVDSLNRQVFETMLGLMSSQTQSAERAVALLLVGRSLERIADHATNIAENVVYLVTGRTVKHRNSF
ncbi:MAG: phosphate signaling complex protein PhoU [Candidatus Eremiobacteraeota bacterium]|nr:phosphate signaling complex protein PhoU [Candidatus Eremiobacteraeota bacterium]MCW5867748.1 phosphate signaling complex protein PhoU [Candidatus Eremiobacteraeota bacterium]